MKKYKIFIGDNYEIKVNIVKTLIAAGYLLGSHLRKNKIADFEYYNSPISDFLSGDYILFGYDNTCRRVFRTIGRFGWLYSGWFIDDFTTITLEEFLKLNYQDLKE